MSAYSLDRAHPHYGPCGWWFCIVGGRRSMVPGFGLWRTMRMLKTGCRLRGGGEQQPISPRGDTCVQSQCGGQDKRS